MRKYIDILNESAPAAKPVIVESEVLEEGVRDQIEAAADSVMKLFHPKHVSYEAACRAIDHIEQVTHGKGYVSYTKDQLVLGQKLATEIAGTVVGVSLTLDKLTALGVPLTAGITAAAASFVGLNIARITGAKRKMVAKQGERYQASPAPANRDDTFESIMSNIAGMRRK
jgi:hypothetical protein